MGTSVRLGAWVAALVVAAAPEAVPTLVDLARVEPRLKFDLRYATADNFAGIQIYPVARCLLRPAVAAKVSRAQAWLDAHAPPLVLLLKDCYRPDSAQRRLFAAVRGTSRQGYVADPDGPTGSVHSYGAAVDVTLADAAGRELDMGTPFDFLGRLAEPRREKTFAAAGKLSAEAVQHRQLLRAALVDGGGFRAIPNEWWHFDAWQGNALRARYGRLDVPLTFSGAAAADGAPAPHP